MTSLPSAFPASCRPLLRRGFTLIELLVVIAILAILAGLTVSVGPSLVGASGMSGSLSAVSSAVSLARSEAIRSRKQTYFALAPESPLDGLSFAAYAILRKEDASGTNYAYVSPWKKLPVGVLFRPDAADSVHQLTNSSLPYPTATGATSMLRVISFVSDGSLEEDLHPSKPRLPLQAGTRAAASDPPLYRGAYLTNEIVVERMSGKVNVQRAGESEP